MGISVGVGGLHIKEAWCCSIWPDWLESLNLAVNQISPAVSGSSRLEPLPVSLQACVARWELSMCVCVSMGFCVCGSVRVQVCDWAGVCVTGSFQ